MIINCKLFAFTTDFHVIGICDTMVELLTTIINYSTEHIEPGPGQGGFNASLQFIFTTLIKLNLKSLNTNITKPKFYWTITKLFQATSLNYLGKLFSFILPAT